MVKLNSALNKFGRKTQQHNIIWIWCWHVSCCFLKIHCPASFFNIEYESCVHFVGKQRHLYTLFLRLLCTTLRMKMKMKMKIHFWKSVDIITFLRKKLFLLSTFVFVTMIIYDVYYFKNVFYNIYNVNLRCYLSGYVLKPHKVKTRKVMTCLDFSFV